MSVVHWQKEKMRKAQKEKSEQEVLQQTKLSKFNSSYRVDSKNKTMSRMNDWVIDNSHNKQMLKSLYSGNQYEPHVSLYNFRQTDKSKMIHDKDVYVKTFMTSQQRGQQCEDHNREMILERNLYIDENEEEYFKNHHIKKRKENLEGPPLRFGGQRTENERLKEKMEQNQLIDPAMKDVKMVHYPDWKEVQKQKWVHQDYVLTFNKSKSAWRQHKIRNQDFNKTLNYENNRHAYDDGLDKIGEDKIARVRNRGKEMQRPEFISTMQRDMWETTIHNSKSVRTDKMDTIMGQTGKDNFSIDNNLMFYKQALISTKSVDKNQPFVHSMNYRDRTLKNIRPNPQKIFKTSIKSKIIDLNVPKVRGGIQSSSFNQNTTSDPKGDFQTINLNNMDKESKRDTVYNKSEKDVKEEKRYRHQLLSKNDKINYIVEEYFGKV